MAFGARGRGGPPRGGGGRGAPRGGGGFRGGRGMHTPIFIKKKKRRDYSGVRIVSSGMR